MITRTIRLAGSLITGAVVVYVVLCVPIGKRTLFEHLSRIISTPEAQELQTDLERAGTDLKEEVEARIETLGNPDAGEATDAGMEVP